LRRADAAQEAGKPLFPWLFRPDFGDGSAIATKAHPRANRQGAAMPRPKKHVLVCVQNRPADHPRGSCGSKGCNAVFQEFSKHFVERGLFTDYLLTNTGCLGPCGAGPSVLVYPDNVMYGAVSPADVATIIDQHLLGDAPVERLVVPAHVW
jgi:(2Fe-2S) ferredoxin